MTGRGCYECRTDYSKLPRVRLGSETAEWEFLSLNRSGFAELTLQQLFQVLSHYGNIEPALIPTVAGGSQCGIVRRAVFAYAFWDYFPPRKQLAMFHADQVVAGRPSSSS